ncbi:CotD family spore coat protein [Bacillus solimangrovi]|uniref:Spore coat protein n=1 Tax=Bacillus solimangrovi TaxID=1305675 RepID=A0A1E5LFX7_9BACI|nr:CotD family spore coat protein [Bacillus solimangrovi]OEH92987.1 hypothetical protein BFG57_14075 [Bacillus solimangrovi]
MYCNRPKQLAPVVHPTKCCEDYQVQKYIVPHIHPTHTTHHVQDIYEHVHMYPQTESTVKGVSHQNFDCGNGGPGMVSPAGVSPEMTSPYMKHHMKHHKKWPRW